MRTLRFQTAAPTDREAARARGRAELARLFDPDPEDASENDVHEPAEPHQPIHPALYRRCQEHAGRPGRVPRDCHHCIRLPG